MLSLLSTLLAACWATSAYAFTTTAATSTLLSSNQQQQQQSFDFALGPMARNGLIYEDVEIGTGRRILPGDAVLCYYVGSYDASDSGEASNPLAGFVNQARSSKVVFDETPVGEPFEFAVGKGQVIPGWDMGIMGSVDLGIPPMNIGGDRKLLIPSELAYGTEGAGPIPPNQDLEFQIEVINAQQVGGVSLGFRLKGYAIALGFAATVLSIGWFLLHAF